MPSTAVGEQLRLQVYLFTLSVVSCFRHSSCRGIRNRSICIDHPTSCFATPVTTTPAYVHLPLNLIMHCISLCKSSVSFKYAPRLNKRRAVVITAAKGNNRSKPAVAAVAAAAAAAALLVPCPGDAAAASAVVAPLIQPAQTVVSKSKGESSEAINIQRVKLAYDLADLEPFIDATTMNFHCNMHYATYVNNTNVGLSTASGAGAGQPSGATDLTGLIRSVNSLAGPLKATIRNQGGGAWNHALYFRQLAPTNSNDAQTPAISAELSRAIESSFGGVDKMKAELTKAATGVFGSGWAWLCVSDSSPAALVVTTTPNQDNPLMGDLPGAPALTCSGCTPVLGIDVWEHAYYVKHGPKRAAYLDAFWNVLNWRQVSQNYANAVAGNPAALVD